MRTNLSSFRQEEYAVAVSQNRLEKVFAFFPKACRKDKTVIQTV